MTTVLAGPLRLTLAYLMLAHLSACLHACTTLPPAATSLNLQCLASHAHVYAGTLPVGCVTFVDLPLKELDLNLPSAPSTKHFLNVIRTIPEKGHRCGPSEGYFSGLGMV